MTTIDFIRMAAMNTQVPFELLRAICTVESGINPEAINPYDGHSASHGLCQIKESTARSVGFKGPVKDLYKPYTNALYSGMYLKHQLTRYKDNWVSAISAYNRGTASTHNKAYVSKVINVMLGSFNDQSRCKNKEYNQSVRKSNRCIQKTITRKNSRADSPNSY